MVEPRKPGRPRSPESHKAVLDAAMSILIESGYQGLNFQSIAERAGVGRQTLYRWWDSKADIALEAFAERTDQDIPVPDTGSVRQDLIELVEISGRVLKQVSAPIVLGLLAEAALDEEFAKKFWNEFQQRRRRVVKNILSRGIERGQLPADLDLDFWADIVFGAMLYRLYSRNGPIDGRFGRQLAEILP